MGRREGRGGREEAAATLGEEGAASGRCGRRATVTHWEAHGSIAEGAAVGLVEEGHGGARGGGRGGAPGGAIASGRRRQFLVVPA